MAPLCSKMDVPSESPRTTAFGTDRTTRSRLVLDDDRTSHALSQRLRPFAGQECPMWHLAAYADDVQDSRTGRDGLGQRAAESRHTHER